MAMPWSGNSARTTKNGVGGSNSGTSSATGTCEHDRDEGTGDIAIGETGNAGDTGDMGNPGSTGGTGNSGDPKMQCNWDVFPKL